MARTPHSCPACLAPEPSLAVCRRPLRASRHPMCRRRRAAGRRRRSWLPVSGAGATWSRAERAVGRTAPHSRVSLSRHPRLNVLESPHHGDAAVPAVEILSDVIMIVGLACPRLLALLLKGLAGGPREETVRICMYPRYLAEFKASRNKLDRILTIVPYATGRAGPAAGQWAAESMQRYEIGARVESSRELFPAPARRRHEACEPVLEDKLLGGPRVVAPPWRCISEASTSLTSTRAQEASRGRRFSRGSTPMRAIAPTGPLRT